MNAHVHNAQHLLYSEVEGPMAKVRTCRVCGFHVVVRKGLRGVGRGYGMKYGNKARGELIQHLNSAHRDAVEGLAAELEHVSFEDREAVAAAFLRGYKAAHR